MKTLFKKRDEPYIYPNYYIQMQRWWVIRMTTFTAGLSKTKLIIILILFVFLTVSYLTYNICKAFSGDNSSIKNTSVISKVKPINETNN